MAKMSKAEKEMLKALRIYDEVVGHLSRYVGHTYGRVGEQAHAHAVEQCGEAEKAQRILRKYDPQ